MGPGFWAAATVSATPQFGDRAGCNLLDSLTRSGHGLTEILRVATILFRMTIFVCQSSQAHGLKPQTMFDFCNGNL